MIINSLLDSDLYKFSMQQAVLELFPEAKVNYRFTNRGKQRFNQEFLEALKEEIKNMSSLALTKLEKNWFKNTCPYFKSWYFEYLENYLFNPDEVIVGLTEDNNLTIDIKGLWHSTILWEVPLMALISELYFRIVDKSWSPNGDWGMQEQVKKAYLKGQILEQNGCYFSEFGTRRRRGFFVQNAVVSQLMKSKTFSGTSNVFLAMINGLKPIGTMAHEWIMANSVLEGLRNANYFGLQNWVRVYNSDLGIALPDTYGVDAFLRNFNKRLAKLYDGVRHDSGDAYVFTDKIVAHYKKCGIDPMSKVIIFSDGLDVDEAIKIANYCKGKIKCAFGIGTTFTNDFDGSPALNMVIKLYSINSVPVVKLSDNPGKATGDKDALRVAKYIFFNTPLDA